MLRVMLLTKRITVVGLLGFAGYTSAQFVIGFTWGSAAFALVVLSWTLPWLFTPAWYIPWIRSLGMPCWLVSLLPTIVMYLVVTYHYSPTSISSVLLIGGLSLVPAIAAWLLSQTAMRSVQQQE